VIEYEVVNGSIRLICPKCSRDGKLLRERPKTYGPKFMISHENYRCHISYFDGPIYEEILEIYRQVRG